MFTDIRERYGNTKPAVGGVAWNTTDAVVVSSLAFRGTTNKVVSSSIFDIVDVVGRDMEPGRDGMIDDRREGVGIAVK
jgi:hypothetical protein